jgi:hypothetical protein
MGVAYDLLETARLTCSADIGYRNLFMDLKRDNDMCWYLEKDIYRGPYATIRVKFSSKEMWK